MVEFGAFVEIMPGTDGLLHISQLSNERVRAVEDVLHEGDEINGQGARRRIAAAKSGSRCARPRKELEEGEQPRRKPAMTR